MAQLPNLAESRKLAAQLIFQYLGRASSLGLLLASFVEACPTFEGKMPLADAV
jgi:hypothetical protein